MSEGLRERIIEEFKKTRHDIYPADFKFNMDKYADAAVRVFEEEQRVLQDKIKERDK